MHLLNHNTQLVMLLIYITTQIGRQLAIYLVAIYSICSYVATLLQSSQLAVVASQLQQLASCCSQLAVVASYQLCAYKHGMVLISHIQHRYNCSYSQLATYLHFCVSNNKLASYFMFVHFNTQQYYVQLATNSITILLQLCISEYYVRLGIYSYIVAFHALRFLLNYSC